MVARTLPATHHSGAASHRAEADALADRTSRRQSIRELNELPPTEIQDVHLIVGCAECSGTGTFAGERCRHCLGNRNISVITFKRPFTE
jgi:hypothetical protein